MKSRFSAVSIPEIILNSLTQNNDFIRIFYSILFALTDKL